MFPLRPRFERFRRGKQALSAVARLFRSASRLPLIFPRNSKLRPGTTKSRFAHLPSVFGRALLAVLSAVLLVTFLVVHFSRDASPTRGPILSSDFVDGSRFTLDVS